MCLEESELISQPNWVKVTQIIRERALVIPRGTEEDSYAKLGTPGLDLNLSAQQSILWKKNGFRISKKLGDRFLQTWPCPLQTTWSWVPFSDWRPSLMAVLWSLNKYMYAETFRKIIIKGHLTMFIKITECCVGCRPGIWLLLVENHWLWRELLFFSSGTRKVFWCRGWWEGERDDFGEVMTVWMMRLNSPWKERQGEAKRALAPWDHETWGESSDPGPGWQGCWRSLVLSEPLLTCSVVLAAWCGYDS